MPLQCVISYSMPVFQGVPPVNLNMYPQTVYNHTDAVIMCCDWDPDPSCIVERDKVTIFTLNDITYAVVLVFFLFFFQYKLLKTVTATTRTIVEVDKDMVSVLLRIASTVGADTVFGQKFDEDRRGDSYFFTYKCCIWGRMGLVCQLASGLLWWWCKTGPRFGVSLILETKGSMSWMSVAWNCLHVPCMTPPVANVCACFLSPLMMKMKPHEPCSWALLPKSITWIEN